MSTLLYYGLRDSKRKIQSVVALREEDRWIGGDAANLASGDSTNFQLICGYPCLTRTFGVQASRFPDSSFPSVKLLLGHSSLDPQAQQYQTVYRTKLYTNSTSGRASYTDSVSIVEGATQTTRWPEEYLALQFNHAKKLAKDAAGGENILDSVVTVS